MKKLLLLSITLFTVLFVNAQIVNIPDANFKYALLNHNPVIDTSGDGEIQINEAIAFSGQMDVSFKNISDLTGIEAFTALTVLLCEHCNLTTIDVSNNFALTYLGCNNNQIISIDLGNISNLASIWCHNNIIQTLDLSNNKDLIWLHVEYNQLTSIDVSNNPDLYYFSCAGNYLNNINLNNNVALHSFWCYNNQLASLDVSYNLDLYLLDCGNNQLSTLDLSNNPELHNLNCPNNQLNSLNLKNGNIQNLWTCSTINNPNLTCIEVDDSTMATIYLGGMWHDFDPQNYFSETCYYNINEISEIEFNIYPNPTTGKIKIQADDMQSVEILTLQGKQVFTGKETVIDLSQEPKGIYIIKVTTGKGVAIEKVVLE